MTLTGEDGELESLVQKENNQLAVQLTIGVLSAVDSLKENNTTTTNTSLVRTLTHIFLQKRSKAIIIIILYMYTGIPLDTLKEDYRHDTKNVTTFQSSL